MTETDPEKRFIGSACISTYGRMLDTQLSRAHLRRRRRSGIGRLTDPTALAQLWLGAGSSCPIPAVDRNGSVRLNSAFTHAPSLGFPRVQSGHLPAGARTPDTAPVSASRQCLRFVVTLSFRGVGVAREPGIYEHRLLKSSEMLVVMDSRPGP